jgi:hypothetical protein
VRKHIWKISDNEGSIFTLLVDIKKEAFDYFNSLYKEQETPNMAAKVKIASMFPKIFTEEDLIRITQPMSLEELKSVLFKFKKSKSPDSDGWSAEFFTFFFDEVGQDLLDMVEDSRRLGLVGGSLNSTFLALIPKTQKPKIFEDF